MDDSAKNLEDNFEGPKPIKTASKKLQPKRVQSKKSVTFSNNKLIIPDCSRYAYHDQKSCFIPENKDLFKINEEPIDENQGKSL